MHIIVIFVLILFMYVCVCVQIDSSLYHGVLELLPDISSDIEHSGKLLVLFEMLQQLHSSSREKIVVVSNFTQVLYICT